MEVSLKKMSENDQLDGLKVLQNITKENFDESPVPFKLDDELYQAFLLQSKEEEENNECIRYWVTLENKKIGYADIRPYADDNNGNIGIILENEYQNKGIGYQTMKLLIEKAQKEYKMKKIEISTGLHNEGMIRTCEKLGAELTSIEENCKYKIK